MSLERQPPEIGKAVNRVGRECAYVRTGFVQTRPRAEPVFPVDEWTAGQVPSTWLCVHTTFWLFHMELRCIFQFQVYLFYFPSLFYLCQVFLNFKMIFFFILFLVQYRQWCCVLNLNNWNIHMHFFSKMIIYPKNIYRDLNLVLCVYLELLICWTLNVLTFLKAYDSSDATH